VPTLVLSPRYSSDSIILRRAAVAEGWNVFRLQGWRVPDELRERNDDIALYGEALFAAAIAEALGRVLLEPPPDWLLSLPAPYLRRAVRSTTLGAGREQGAPAFIKPADGKMFPARVYASGLELPLPEIVPDATAVLVSDPVDWGIEFRPFVLDGWVITFSPYLRRGQLAQADDGSWSAAPGEIEAALEFAARVLGDPAVELPPAVVLDVGIITERGWAVVEANAAWASGLYGCDPARVLPVLARACVPADRLLDTDRRWMVERTGE